MTESALCSQVCFLLSCSMSWWTETMAVPRGTWINLGFLMILMHLMHQPVSNRTVKGIPKSYSTNQSPRMPTGDECRRLD